MRIALVCAVMTIGACSQAEIAERHTNFLREVIRLTIDDPNRINEFTLDELTSEKFSTLVPVFSKRFDIEPFDHYIGQTYFVVNFDGGPSVVFHVIDADGDRPIVSFIGLSTDEKGD